MTVTKTLTPDGCVAAIGIVVERPMDDNLKRTAATRPLKTHSEQCLPRRTIGMLNRRSAGRGRWDLS